MEQFVSIKELDFQTFKAFRTKTGPAIDTSVLYIGKLRVPFTLMSVDGRGQKGKCSFDYKHGVLTERFTIGSSYSFCLHSHVDQVGLDGYKEKLFQLLSIRFYGELDHVPIQDYEVDLEKMALLLSPQLKRRLDHPYYVMPSTTHPSALYVASVEAASEKILIHFNRDGKWYIDSGGSTNPRLYILSQTIEEVFVSSSLRILFL